MDSAKTWAGMFRVMGSGLNAAGALNEEPQLLIQRVARNVFLYRGPNEYFSKEMPYLPSKNVDVYPIDILYGKYNPKTCSIDIFFKSIYRDARLFNATEDELIKIVRIHEYAHAIIHVGIIASNIKKRLSTFGHKKKTEWSSFLGKRTFWFNKTSEELHEFLAQALTYSCLFSLSEGSEKFLKVYNSLESKQPDHYMLSDKVKERACKANWPLVLAVARREIKPPRKLKVTLREVLEEILCIE